MNMSTRTMRYSLGGKSSNTNWKTKKKITYFEFHFINHTHLISEKWKSFFYITVSLFGGRTRRIISAICIYIHYNIIYLNKYIAWDSILIIKMLWWHLWLELYPLIQKTQHIKDQKRDQKRNLTLQKHPSHGRPLDCRKGGKRG